jgi:hypothetical protein
MEIEFKNHIDLTELISKYRHTYDEYVNMQIGHDGNIYILFNRNIPERIDGMFVPSVSNSIFTVLELEIDWNEEKIINEKYYGLGAQKMNYRFVQPISEGFLLVSARCRYNKGNPEKNAAIVDFKGNMIDEFCLGDGISYCFVHPDLGIVTGYFDEGVFGNYGWDEPLGSYGVRVWGRGSQDIWKSDKNIYDCYAMNVSETGTVWYYYYDEFKLVKESIKESCDIEYDPEIEGADSLIISEDESTIVMDKGYDAHDEYVAKRIQGERLSDEVPVDFMYKGKNCKVSLISSYGSKAAFVEDGTLLLIKRF